MSVAVATALAFAPCQGLAQAPTGQSSAPPATSSALPIMMKWMPVVGEEGGLVPMEQAANERLARHIYLERVLDDGRTFAIRWRVLPDGPYPAKPDLFRTEDYPSGVVHMGKGQRTADVVIKTYETGKPDWKREFKVVLTDAETGNPVLSQYMTPIELSFLVFGDLACAPGRSDLCDDDPDREFEGNPFGLGGKPRASETGVEKPR
jgi:hypothetical protein